ncbi:DUF1837 domain-containing protein [Paenibacillus sp. LMG 31461]|uniref:DUF1837 domain-containing protein n=1 Tax=Paenibacillus plantarum TaxID=2654975 RepID=A0ABX1XBE6_9BACL|nr:Hachiman antiphage defense system protein HamA [Paenibacillus plantarum]NOU65778.1 DUF1837 domain-containing protein [Paenibacillus plantarum]
MGKKYYEIFEDLIGSHMRNLILYEYNSEQKNHMYHPYRHNYKNGTEELLASFMRKYIYFYAYSEREVEDAFEYELLSNLEAAATFALQHRLPKRNGSSNGLYSELLLDLLITLFRGNVNKLATRAIYRQMSDNQEIKGFDGLHIVTSETENELWLGQAKMGDTGYCLRSIASDLEQKTNMLYTSKQLYFVADKEKSAVKEALEVLKKINMVSMKAEMRKLSEVDKASELNEFFKKEKIKIVFPCLLAYSSPDVYEVEDDIDENIKNELSNLIEKFDSKFDSLLDIEYQVLILFIPIRDLEILRRKMVEINGA